LTLYPRGVYACQEPMKPNIKNQILRRLKIAKGQMNGLEKMIEDEKYCVDIITQSSAIRQALSGVENLMLENHLSTHALMQMKHGEGDKATKEIMKVYKLSKKI